jgi:hypothetical protein
MRIRPDRWLWGLPFLAALWVLTTTLIEPRLAEDLVAGAAPVVARSGEKSRTEPWLSVAVEGRDLVASGEATGPEARATALQDLARVAGVRRVIDLIGFVATPRQFTLTATWDGTRLRTEGFRPAEIGREAFEGLLRAGIPGEARLEDATRAGSGAPEAFVDLASLAVRGLAFLSNGTATVVNRTLSLTGKAATPEAYNGALAALKQPPHSASLGVLNIEPPVVRPFLWNAERRPDGALVLAGHVPSEPLRGEVTRAAEGIAPGLVEDRMQTATGAPSGVDYLAVVRFGLAELGQMQEGKVSVSETSVSLTGAAVKGAIPDLRRAVERRLPSGLRPGAVELRPAIVDPYVFSARRTPDSVVLEGYYPDERTREAVLKIVRPRFFGEAILDRGRLADGAPPDFMAGVETAVAQLSYLASGEASLRGRGLTLRGESLYPQAAEKVGQTVAAAAPQGWSVAVDVKPRAGGPAGGKP